jgi:aminocarboxymuconate-semialdehyde decarboxylase
VSGQRCHQPLTRDRQVADSYAEGAKPTEYLRQLYYDALVFTPEALRHLVAEVGSGQIMLGTDYPFPWEEHPVNHVLATETLTDDEKIAILGGNAARLFGLPG